MDDIGTRCWSEFIAGKDHAVRAQRSQWPDFAQKIYLSQDNAIDSSCDEASLKVGHMIDFIAKKIPVERGIILIRSCEKVAPKLVTSESSMSSFLSLSAFEILAQHV